MLSANCSARSPNTSGTANDVLYCGYRFDPQTGLYHVRNRMYHAQLGRCLQRDPKGYVDGLGLYEYCKSGPVIGTDPYGAGDFWVGSAGWVSG